MIRSEINLFGHSAQSILCAEVETPAAACGTACGAGDKEEKPAAACGTACGAGDKEEKPAAACGTACGAGDK